MDSVAVDRNIDVLGTDAMFVVIVHGVACSNECRNIATCFARQILVYLPEIAFASRSGDGFIDVARSAVVGGNGQSPIVIDIVQVA